MKGLRTSHRQRLVLRSRISPKNTPGLKYCSAKQSRKTRHCRRIRVNGTVASAYRPGELMRMVADRLRARGLDVGLPAIDEARRLSVRGGGGRCELSVGDC